MKQITKPDFEVKKINDASLSDVDGGAKAAVVGMSVDMDGIKLEPDVLILDEPTATIANVRDIEHGKFIIKPRK